MSMLARWTAVEATLQMRTPAMPPWPAVRALKNAMTSTMTATASSTKVALILLPALMLVDVVQKVEPRTCAKAMRSASQVAAGTLHFH